MTYRRKIQTVRVIDLLKPQPRVDCMACYIYSAIYLFRNDVVYDSTTGPADDQIQTDIYQVLIDLKRKKHWMEVGEVI